MKYNHEIETIRWLNASEERDPVWWEKAWSLVPASIDDIWEELMAYDADRARPLCIESYLTDLRDKLPEDIRPEVDQVIDDLDTRPGDLDELMVDYVNRNKEEAK